MRVPGWSVCGWGGRGVTDGRTDGIIGREGRWLVAQKPVWTAAAERFSCQKPEATAAAAITSDLGAGKFGPYVGKYLNLMLDAKKKDSHTCPNKQVGS